MATVKATWALPTPTRDQRAIKHVRLELSADAGANFTALGNVLAAAPQEFVLTDVDPGSNYRVRATIVDSADVAGTPLVRSFVVNATPPGQVQNLVVTVT